MNFSPGLISKPRRRAIYRRSGARPHHSDLYLGGCANAGTCTVNSVGNSDFCNKTGTVRSRLKVVRAITKIIVLPKRSKFNARAVLVRCSVVQLTFKQRRDRTVSGLRGNIICSCCLRPLDKLTRSGCDRSLLAPSALSSHIFEPLISAKTALVPL